MHACADACVHPNSTWQSLQRIVTVLFRSSSGMGVCSMTPHTMQQHPRHQRSHFTAMSQRSDGEAHRDHGTGTGKWRWSIEIQRRTIITDHHALAGVIVVIIRSTPPPSPLPIARVKGMRDIAHER